MIKGKTQSGFEFEIDERKITDQDFLDAIIETEEAERDIDKLKATRRMYIMVLGTDGYEALKKHIRTKEEGFCSAETVAKEFEDILTQVKGLKNL